jgi:hypothetical protein
LPCDAGGWLNFLIKLSTIHSGWAALYRYVRCVTQRIR